MGRKIHFFLIINKLIFTIMRKVLFKKWIQGAWPDKINHAVSSAVEGTNCWEKDYTNTGRFHQWGQSYEEFENGPGNFTVALVELSDGTIVEVLPPNLKFVDQTIPDFNLKTIGNLMIDDQDLFGSFNWDEAKARVKLLNSQDYKGFNDWRLPTKKELNLIYENRDAIGGFSSNFYWSNTKDDAYYAWYQNFSNGYRDFNNKSYNRLVRCVRSV